MAAQPNGTTYAGLELSYQLYYPETHFENIRQITILETKFFKRKRILKTMTEKPTTSEFKITAIKIKNRYSSLLEYKTNWNYLNRS